MIRNTLLLFPIIIVLTVYFLQEGISVNSLKIGNFKLQGLYLKLDNKLIVKIDKLTIPKEHNKESLSDIDKTLNTVKRVLAYFEYIELGSVVYTNDEYRIIYSDEIVYLNNNDYEIAAEIILQNGGMVAKIPQLYIKKYKLRLDGEMTYGYDSEKLTFKGNYRLLNVEGGINVQMHDSKISFLLNSKEVSSISAELDMFEIPTDIRVWIDKRVLAKKYKVEEFRGEGTLGENGFELDVNKTSASVELKDVTILFDTKLKPVTSNEVLIRLHSNRLDFDLKEPFYNQKRMSGSKVALLHLTGKEHLRLLLKLKFNTQYDNEIEEILKEYGVKIPIKQKSGTMRAEVDLDVDLDTEDTKVQGRVFLSKGKIVLGAALLKVYGGELTFTSSRVALWNVDIYDSWYRGLVNGFVNLDSQKANLKVNLDYLTLGDKKGTSIAIKNKKGIKVLMDFGSSVKFDIPIYNISIEALKQSGIKIVNSDIRPLLPYINGLPLQVGSGKFSVRTDDYKAYYFKGKGVWKRSYIYDKKGYVSTVPFEGRYKNNKLTLKALGGKFLYDGKKSIIRIKNLNINAKKMIELYTSKTGNQLNKLKVKGSNSIIRYGKHVLLTDIFNLSISGKNTIFTAKKDGDIVRVEKNRNSLVVHANKIKDRMLKALINFGGLQGGRYSLELLGSVKGEMKGVIDIEGGAVESFKAYNDLIALFNTIPALMTLSNPGFSQKGFVVRDGKIEFRILPDRVVFDNIYINGKSSTIAGKGSVELGSGKLNIDLAVRTAREVGKVLGSLPLVGYILFGKDKSITTGVKIVGTLDNPEAKTNPVQEALLYPLELIKRTVTSPAHIINN